MDWINSILITVKNDTGAKFGLLAAFLKLAQCVRNRKINIVNVLVMIPSTILVGSVSWKITGGQDIAEWMRISFTLYLSINVFLILEFIQNPKLLEHVFETFAPLKEEKKDEKSGDS